MLESNGKPNFFENEGAGFASSGIPIFDENDIAGFASDRTLNIDDTGVGFAKIDGTFQTFAKGNLVFVRTGICNAHDIGVASFHMGASNVASGTPESTGPYFANVAMASRAVPKGA